MTDTSSSTAQLRRITVSRSLRICILFGVGLAFWSPLDSTSGELVGKVSRLGLPQLDAPVAAASSRQQMAALGAKLFFDDRLSQDGKHSCASCHLPAKFFSDGNRVSEGVFRRLGTRNAPSLLNVAYNPTQFWDGRDDTLEHQALRPLTNPREMAMTDHTAVIDVLNRDKAYLSLFKASFGQPGTPLVTIDRVAQALSAYERTLLVGDSAFDRYMYAQDKTAMTASAVRGYDLFVGVAKCASCHTIQPQQALLTDNTFHALTVGMGKIAPRLAELTMRLATERSKGVPLDNIVLTDDDFAELGRFAVTLDPRDIGTFRTPSLRNVAVTAPYMHDGSVATLAEAVDLEVYYRSNEQGHPLLLTPDERQDLIAFLGALTSDPGAVAALAPPQHRPRQMNSAAAPARATAPAAPYGSTPASAPAAGAAGAERR